MRATEFLPLDIRSVNVRQFDRGKSAINTYPRRYAAKNMGLNLNRTFVLSEAPRPVYRCDGCPMNCHESLAADSEDAEKSGLGHALLLFGFQSRPDLAQFQQGIHQVGMFQRQLQDMVLQLLKLRSCIEGHG